MHFFSKTVFNHEMLKYIPCYKPEFKLLRMTKSNMVPKGQCDLVSKQKEKKSAGIR